MLRTLLAKDLRRTWRNPVPWIVQLSMPIMLTALVGMIFGDVGGGGGGSLGRIDVALVDEDDTGLTEFLQGALEQMRTSDAEEGPPFELHVEFLSRDEAMRRLTENQLAAALILPAGFTDGLLDGNDARTTIELVKNPARAVQPRIVEEMLGLFVTVLNAAKDLAGEDLAALRALIESDDDFLSVAARVGTMLVNLRDRLQPVKDYLAPPLISYEEEARADMTESGSSSASGATFAFVLAGAGAMFLLFLTDHAMRDLYREARARTLERYQTLRDDLFTLLASKVIFGVVAGLIGAVILFGGGAMIFQFTWQRPAVLVVLIVAYALCGAGLMGLLAAIAGAEKRADFLNSMIVMALALLGGCMFPVETFPVFLREHITPLLPTNWFVAAVRAVHFGDASVSWALATAKLLILAVVATMLAVWLFRRRVQQGVRG